MLIIAVIRVYVHNAKYSQICTVQTNVRVIRNKPTDMFSYVFVNKVPIFGNVLGMGGQNNVLFLTYL